MDKCSCWREDRYVEYYDQIDRPVYESRYKCYGTPERYECSCGGDRMKCNFYPDVREEANIKANNELNNMVLEFYRWYIMENNLFWDTFEEYKKWSEKLEV